MKKSILSVVLCLAMLLTMLTSAFAMSAQAATVMNLLVAPYANDTNYATVTVENGVATAVVTEPWNQESNLAYGMAIEPILTKINLNQTPTVALALESDVPFRITMLDRSEAGDKWISFGAEFYNSIVANGAEVPAAAPENGFFPAGTYDCTAYLAGVYTWKTDEGVAGWDVTNANITALYIELQEAGTLSLSKLELQGDGKEPATPMGDLITISAPTVDAIPGDIIEMPISITENHYLVNGQLKITYDPEKLEIQKVWDDIDNPYFETHDSTIIRNAMVAFAVQTPGEGIFAFASSGSKGVAKGGVIFTLTFKVLEGCTGTTEIAISAPELASNNADTNDGKDYATNYEMVNGVVVTPGDDTSRDLGDITGDGKINIQDAVQLYYYVNGKVALNDEALTAANMNGDAKVNIQDAVSLYYMVNGKV